VLPSIPEAPAEPAPPDEGDALGGHRLVVAATVVAAMLVLANVSVLNVALPVLTVELGASQVQSQWMVDIYAVVLASLLLPIGAIGDRFGRRMILLVGLVILMAANLATLGLDSANAVIVARAVSGLGAAFVFPATLSTITATLPDEKRSTGVTIWTAAVAVGGFFGILGSALLIENYWWGSLFLAMGILSAVVLVICWLVVPDSADPSETNVDPIGGVLSALAIGGLVLGIIEGPVKGWTSTVTAAGLVVGVVAAVAFVAWELRTARPLLDVRLFAERGLRAGSLSVFGQYVGAFGFFFVIVFYLGIVRAHSPLDIGLSLVLISLGLLPAAAIAIPAAARGGRRIVGATGLAFMGVAFVIAALIEIDSSFGHVILVFVVVGIGFGFAGPPATEAIVEALPPAKQGVASALNDVFRELGAAIGIAIAGSAFNSAYRASIDEIDAFPAEVLEPVRESPFAVPFVAAEFGEAAPILVDGVRRATVEGWVLANWTLVAAMGVAALGFSWWAPRPRRARQRREMTRRDGPRNTTESRHSSASSSIS